MSNIQLSNAGNDPASNDQVVAPTTTITHEMGVIHSESSTVKSAVGTGPHQNQTFPSTELGNFLERPTEILNLTLTAADAPLTTLVAFNPIELFLSNARIQDKTETFLYIRGSFKITLVTAAPGMAYGEYAVSAEPLGNTASTVAFHPESCYAVDHYARLDISTSPTIEMVLPWLYHWDVATIAQLESAAVELWQIRIIPLAAVATATPGGVATASVQVFAQFMPDVEMVVPHFQAKPTHSKKAKALLEKHGLAQKAAGTHKAVDKVGAIADKLASVPIIGPYAATASRVAHGVSKAMSFFGFTRENHEVKPMPVITKSVTNVAHFEGDDAGESASFAMVNEISIDPRIAGDTDDDELSFASLGNRWGLVNSFTWSTTQVKGATVGQQYISPSCGRFNGTSLKLPAIGYVGAPFEFWRGDMEYMLVIPVSKVHRGTLQVFWTPFGSGTATTLTNVTLNQIIDISADETPVFGVGYSREAPFADNTLFHSDWTIIPQGSTNGGFQLRVINPLTAPDPLASVQILVFARGGANMEFAVPRSHVRLFVTGDPAPVEYPMENLVLQGALGDEGAGDEEAKFQLVPSSGAFPADELFFGERVASARALFQKPTRLNFFTWAGDYFTTLPKLGVCPTGVDVISELYARWSWQAHYRVLFVGLAASERFKFISTGWNNINAEAVIGAANYKTTTTSPTQPPTLAPLTSIGAGKGAEFVIPWYLPKKYEGALIPTTGSPGLYTNYTNMLINFLTGALEVEKIPGVWYHSYGPDVRSAGFRSVPGIRAEVAAYSVIPFL
jgi:hypothetical protein